MNNKITKTDIRRRLKSLHRTNKNVLLTKLLLIHQLSGCGDQKCKYERYIEQFEVTGGAVDDAITLLKKLKKVTE